MSSNGPTRGPDLLHTAEGRIRLGWRLLVYLLLMVSLWVALAVVLPAGILSSAVAMLIASVASGAFLLAREGRGPAALGFHLRRGAWSESLLGLALGVTLGLVVVATIALAGGVQWTTQSGSAADWVVGALAALVFLSVPAAAEEAFLRGYPLQAASEIWGPIPALVVTSLAFGALHLANPSVTTLGVANVAAAGILLGVVYLKTASLWWATGAHLGWNWSHGYLADVPVSGLELMDAPFYDGAPRGPEWLGGGAFGPEGSLVATVLVLGAAVALWRSDRFTLSAGPLAAGALAFEGAGGAVPTTISTERGSEG